MKLRFQVDLWGPSPGHLEPAGTRELQAPVSSRHAGKIAQTWLTQRAQKSLVYPVNIKNPVEKQTNKQTKKSQDGFTKLGMMIDDCLAHVHKPDFELLLRIYFELYFLLFFFSFPFVLVLLSTLYGDRKALSVFFIEKTSYL